MAQAADGDLDPLFGSGGMVMTDLGKSTDLAEAVAIQADGKLVVVGTTYKNNDFSTEDFVVTRYNTDGTLDISFGNGGKVRTYFPGLAAVPSSVVIQPDGKIVVAGGAFPLFTFPGDFEVVRYNTNGSLDTSFGDGGIVTTIFPAGSYAFDVALQSDGKIIAAGTHFVDFDPGESSDTDFALARYNPDGTPDATFGVGGQVTTDFVGRDLAANAEWRPGFHPGCDAQGKIGIGSFRPDQNLRSGFRRQWCFSVSSRRRGTRNYGKIVVTMPPCLTS